MKDFIQGLKVVIIACAVVAAAWLMARDLRYDLRPVGDQAAYVIDRRMGQVVVVIGTVAERVQLVEPGEIGSRLRAK